MNRAKTIPKSKLRATVKYNLPLILLASPAIIYVILFRYLPMYGTIIAFRDYDYSSIWGSRWVGLKYFEYFFSSNDAAAVIRNTVFYNLFFIFVSQILSMTVGLCLYEVTKRKLLKVYQTSIIVPSFISWVLVAYIGFALMSNDNGMFNKIIEVFGGKPVNWYTEPKYWPVILSVFYMWKNIGMGCIIYYAALMGLDSSLFEAATIDGAGKLKQIRYISIPSLLPIVSVLLIMALGNIMGGDVGLFLQLPRDSGALYGATDILNTYQIRGLLSGNFSQATAVGLFQSITGLVLVLSTNFTVRKISPEHSLF